MMKLTPTRNGFCTAGKNRARFGDDAPSDFPARRKTGLQKFDF